MTLPDPKPGLVIRYAYLWHREMRLGRDEGSKDRPCAVVLATAVHDDGTVVTVAPITHAPQSPDSGAVALPAETQRRLGLDSEPAWIVTREVNRFVWPGPDLRPIDRGADRAWAYGYLPYGLRRKVREAFLLELARRRLRAVERD